MKTAQRIAKIEKSIALQQRTNASLLKCDFVDTNASRELCDQIIGQLTARIEHLRRMDEILTGTADVGYPDARDFN
jgi:hypothetical protein